MERSLRIIFAAALLCCSNLIAEEVISNYEVTINGQKVTLQDGKLSTLKVNDQELNVSVRPAEFKRFDDGIVSFEFPATHSVGKEEEGDLITWSMDGQDNTLLLMRIKGTDPAEFVKDMIASLKEQYGEKGAKISESSIKLGERSVQGKRITTGIVGHTIVQEIYRVEAGPYGYVLVIQDSEAKETEETKRLKARLSETFKFGAIQNGKK